jgi:hypothetical protein
VYGGCEVGPSNLSYVTVPSLCMVYAPGTYISLPSFVVVRASALCVVVIDPAIATIVSIPSRTTTDIDILFIIIFVQTIVRV